MCRYCGSDVTISNFFLNKLSPFALFASNQSIYNQEKILVQTLENSLGVQFKVAIVQKANCAAINIKVSAVDSAFPFQFLAEASKSNNFFMQFSC